jgi:DNA-binding CsgD family transcriptional regulator
MRFTQREFEILNAMRDGYDTTAELAELFIVTPKTIKVHFNNMFERTGIHRRHKLLAAAIRNGWLSPNGNEPGETTA